MPLLRDDHPRGPEHPVAEPVPLLDHLEHIAVLAPLRGLREQRLVDMRVEDAVGDDLDEALSLERLPQRARGRG